MNIICKNNVDKELFLEGVNLFMLSNGETQCEKIHKMPKSICKYNIEYELLDFITFYLLQMAFLKLQKKILKINNK